MRQAFSFPLIWTLVWAAAIALEIGCAVQLSEGHLIYTIDDPYIHLAVGETLLEGGFGVNAGEFSSPCSSILYPLLLGLTLALGFGSLGPLVLNLAATGLSVWLLLDFFWKQTVPKTKPRPGLFPHLMAPLLILAINAVALPMTGMEHSLHVLAVIATMRGLVQVVEGGGVSYWLLAAIVAMPLLRFEGIALAAAACLILFLAGRRGAAVVASASIVGALVAYAGTMHSLGLPLLPSSVLAKSDVTSSFVESLSLLDNVTSLMRNALQSLNQRWGLIFALGACASLSFLPEWIRPRGERRSPQALIALAVAIGLCAHVLAGKYGWFHRYEVYGVALLLMGGLYVLRPGFLELHSRHALGPQLSVLMALALVVVPYAQAIATTPKASRFIYEQQFQMHRFATEFFPRAVAVNDLGWVSYRNDAYVLDLLGLGSERIRALRASGRLDAPTLREIVDQSEVEFAMIYEGWFEGILPESWCLLAILETERVTTPDVRVSFYATRASAVSEMEQALDRFGSSLPDRVSFERRSCQSPRVLDAPYD